MSTTIIRNFEHNKFNSALIENLEYNNGLLSGANN